MNDLLAILTVVSGFLLATAAERRVHRYNYDFLTFAGAEELIPKLMKTYYQLSIYLLPAALVERLLVGNQPSRAVQTLALVAVMLGLSLRIWTIRSLGRQWTMRCLFVAGLPRSSKGPFRFMSHPEYVSRVIDGVGLAVFMGSYVTAAVYAVLSVRFGLHIVRVETRQLEELARPLTDLADPQSVVS